MSCVHPRPLMLGWLEQMYTSITGFKKPNHNKNYRKTIWWVLNVNAYELFIYTGVHLPRSAGGHEELCEWWCNLLVRWGSARHCLNSTTSDGASYRYPAEGFPQLLQLVPAPGKRQDCTPMSCYNSIVALLYCYYKSSLQITSFHYYKKMIWLMHTPIWD